MSFESYMEHRKYVVVIAQHRKYVVVIARCRVQYGKYFPCFSYFASYLAKI